MKYKVKLAKKVKKQLIKLNSKELDSFEYVVTKLSKDEPLEAKYKDHQLKGNYKGFRECHIKPDLLLIYRKNKDILELYLASLGSHSYVF
ncbi:putative toxin-antitoxin system, toxin component, YafQ family [Campylobacter avium LMG 24591]|uniref:Putative toxin-antitoxin system, toxin component, YafQ family n=1 Tax=Campylobacter avium LMG 24591 TaxID=522484 RepID=A0A222MXC3_9BACT|nr:type II toxin-antitoxin system YafQ family toxin [Campylobacter avium]ASQ30206.1 putative toxin-antitoxin system, toxin component, YafQ family [Campylobacter avium LMG 24591]OYD79304.1 putative toxin-antitoxin system, toxin component, YafQ family [Campylobacter avium]